MADRTSAGIFARIFKYLSCGDMDESFERKRARQFAHELWDMARNYDFSPGQMDCDDHLVKLGLAHWTPDGMAYKGGHNFKES